MLSNNAYTTSYQQLCNKDTHQLLLIKETKLQPNKILEQLSHNILNNWKRTPLLDFWSNIIRFIQVAYIRKFSLLENTLTFFLQFYLYSCVSKRVKYVTFHSKIINEINTLVYKLLIVTLTYPLFYFNYFQLLLFSDHKNYTVTFCDGNF